MEYKNKPTLRQYNSAINKAKKFVKMRNELRYEIAKLSFEVCYSTLGGQIPRGCYGVQRFADDIGLGYKVLQRWRREYDLVVSKIGVANVNDIKRKALDSTLKAVDKKTSQKEVRNIYNQYLNKERNPEDAYVLDIAKRIKSFNFGISHKLILSKCDQEQLAIIHSVAKEIVKTLDNHFKGKKKKVIVNRKAVKRVQQILNN